MANIHKETINLSVADGAELVADIYHASNQPPRGVLLMAHGFAGDKQEGGLFPLLAEQAADQGFSCLAYNWRGIAPSTGDFANSNIEQHVADFIQIAHWAREHFPDNPSGLSAAGFSLGAAVVGLALREDRNLLQRVIYLAPALRPNASMWPRYEQIWNEIPAEGTIQKPGSSIMLGRSVLESLRDTDLGGDAFTIGVPLLACHGTADERIPCEHSQALAAQIGSGTDFTYEEFVGASHSFRPEDRRRQLVNTVVTWLSEKIS